MKATDIVKLYGTVSKAAKILGVSRLTVYNWKRRGIPQVRQAYIEKQTKGKLKAAPDSVA